LGPRPVSRHLRAKLLTQGGGSWIPGLQESPFAQRDKSLQSHYLKGLAFYGHVDVVRGVPLL